MGRFIDETGNRYGRLTVLYRVKNDKKIKQFGIVNVTVVMNVILKAFF